MTPPSRAEPFDKARPEPVEGLRTGFVEWLRMHGEAGGYVKLRSLSRVGLQYRGTRIVEPPHSFSEITLACMNSFRYSSPPAFESVPLMLKPPNGSTPTSAPVILRLK
ncbi:MAG: hypothetical protein QOF51_2483 [Chloroflexota bacterium]|nr:hypothetical protein [Chloroflexota bacterium]